MKLRSGFSGATLRQRLLACFVLVAILPLLVNVLLSFRSTRQQILQNRDQIANLDVQQITRDLDHELTAYENVLYQLYTDDELSDLVLALDRGQELALTRNQIRRELRSVFWLQDYITSIMVITRSGETAFYDRLSFSGQTNIALEALAETPTALFDAIAGKAGTTYLPTRYATYFNGQSYDLFYMGHRILGQRINQTDAVILMGIDATLFSDALSANFLGPGREKYMFLADAAGQLIWYPDRTYIGESTGDMLEFVAQNNRLESHELAVYYRTSEVSGWQVTSVMDCSTFTRAIDQRLAFTVAVSVVSFLVAVALVWVITRRLTQAVDDICHTMQEVSEGNLAVRVDNSHAMTPEIRTIATGLDTMADKLQALMQAQAESAEKVKNAEIAALEAQLNPHFLYNTLDTLNWMAIEAEEYAMSNVISALGKTLRYGIDFSNAIVTMEDETAWLKQYLFIHQNRLQNSFHCEIEIPPEVLPCRVHKLFLQPFVENTMLHGFSQSQADCRLVIRAALSDGKLQVEVTDNGVGIPREVLDGLSTSQSRINPSKRYHGMQNAINRLLLYYGAEAEISMESSEESGTRIFISIPADIGEEAKPCAL